MNPMDHLLRGLRSLLGEEGGGRNPPNRDFWVDDQACASCYECGTAFTLINRKHHCRVCGRVFCGKCTLLGSLGGSSAEELPVGAASADDRERVCHLCFEVVNPLGKEAVNVAPRGLGRSGASESRAQEQTRSAPDISLLAPTLWPRPQSFSSGLSAEWPIKGQVSQPASAGQANASGTASTSGQRSNLAPSQQPQGPVPSPFAAESLPLQTTSRHGSPTTAPPAATEAGIKPPPPPEEGAESKGSSLSRNRAQSFGSQGSPKSAMAASMRASSFGAGRPGAEPALASQPQTQALAQPQGPEVATTAKKPEPKRQKRALACPGGMKKLLADMKVKWKVPPALEEAMNAEEILHVRPVADQLVLGDKAPGVEWLANAAEKTVPWLPATEALQTAFADVAKDHISAIAKQLLASEGLDPEGRWLPLVQRLAASAVASLCPEATTLHGQLDVCFYVKVKCIGGIGSPEESEMVKGVVFRKNPATRTMPTHKDNPRILLLGGSIEYQRTQNRLCNLETVVMQEREHMRTAVNRIAQYLPDVVLVEKTVARCALDLFVDLGICVILSCTRKLLNRLARCTGAEVAPSVEQLTSSCVATCKSFQAVSPSRPRHQTAKYPPRRLPTANRVVSFFAPPASPPPPVDPHLGRPNCGLCVFDGCPKPLGCTILLRGGSKDELKRIKRVVQFLSYAFAHTARESSLLAYLSLTALPPVLKPDAGGVLPVTSRSWLVVAPRAVRRMAEQAEAARADEPLLSISPHVVPLHGRHAANVQYTDLEQGPLPVSLQGHMQLGMMRPMGADSGGTSTPTNETTGGQQLQGSAAMAGIQGGNHQRSQSHISQAMPAHMRSLSVLGGGGDSASGSHQRSNSFHVSESGKGSGGRPSPEPSQVLAPLAPLPPWASQDQRPNEISDVLYAWQRLYLNTSNMNPDKAVLCQAPEVTRVDFYTSIDTPLLKFVEAMDRGSPYSKATRCRTLIPVERCLCCGDGPTEHVYTLLHGVGRVTITVKRLAGASSGLPTGEKTQRLWLWSRRGGVAPKLQANPHERKPKENSKGEAKPKSKNGDDKAAKSSASDKDDDHCRRLPLSKEAAYVSLGQFLSLAFGGLHLAAPDLTPLCEQRVIYLGLGHSVVAFHTERIHPQVLIMPSFQVGYFDSLQSKWLHRQIDSVLKEATLAFDALQDLIRKHTSTQDDSVVLLEGLQSDAGVFEDRLEDLRGLCDSTGDQYGCTSLMVVAQINATKRDLTFKAIEWASVVSDTLVQLITTAALPLEEGSTSELLSRHRRARSTCILPDDRDWTDSHPEANDSHSNPRSHHRRASSLSGGMEGSILKRAILSGTSSLKTLPGLVEAEAEDEGSGSSAGSTPTRSPGPELQWPMRQSGSTSSLAIVAPSEREGLRTVVSQDPSGALDPTDKALLLRSVSVGGRANDIAQQALDRDSPNKARDRGSPRHPSTSRERQESEPKKPPVVSAKHLSGRSWLPSGEDDTIISIFDDEPTSVIAHVLQSQPYREWMRQTESRLRGDPGPQKQTDRPQKSGGHRRSGSFPSPNLATLAEDTEPDRPRTKSDSQGKADEHEDEDESDEVSQSLLVDQGSATHNTAAKPPTAPQAPAAAAGAGQQPSSGRPVAHSRSSSFVGAILGSVVGGSSNMDYGEGPETAEPWQQADDWQIMLSSEALDYTVTFEDSTYPNFPTATFTATAYFAPQFKQLRQRVIDGGEDAFVASLSRCRKWLSQGGKSNAYFAKTLDDRFIIKQLQKPEKQSFLAFGPAYFRYLADSIHKGRPTCLAKIFGIYTVEVRGGARDKTSKNYHHDEKSRTVDIIVMENIFYGRSISRIYDLKGSVRGRYNAAASGPGNSSEVLLDENLLESIMDHPLCVDAGDSVQLENALWTDTAFLARLGVMDYSLLVGVDNNETALVVGIIDFIRQYTIDKQLETLLKSSGLLGGSGQQPTVVSPRQYMRRFRAAMSSYFTIMPDSDPQHPHLNPDS